MKVILGDNQFFGINHSDLKKGDKIKSNFLDEEKISDFIHNSIKNGLDGFMINSNSLGYEVVSNYRVENNEEIHYSIPYPHKYATMVNENGMISLLFYFIKRTSFIALLSVIPKFLFTRDLKFLLPIATSLEIPKSLPKGSVVYLQNILTDLLIGINRVDILEYFALEMRKNGYRFGLITLNPTQLDKIIESSDILNKKDLIVCFNINVAGFNVFPNRKEIEKFIFKNKNYSLMGMSILASGGIKIAEAIDYIKNLNLDYVVFGSSKMKNIVSNLQSLRSD